MMSEILEVLAMSENSARRKSTVKASPFKGTQRKTEPRTPIRTGVLSTPPSLSCGDDRFLDIADRMLGKRHVPSVGKFVELPSKLLPLILL
jgi:hypothetical protein